MNCKKCKKEIPAESIYCMWCGVAQKRDKKKPMYQRPDGLFEKSMQLDGKRVTFRGKTEKEVIKKIAAFDGVKAKGRAFPVVAEEWRGEAWERISPNSRRNYSKPYDRAVEHFKGAVAEIDSDAIRAFLYELIKKGYAQKTILAHRMVLNQIFDTAIMKGDIQINPVTNVKLPKNLPKSNRSAPTDAEIETIKTSVSAPFGLFALFILHTGCRLGEALAVTGSDIDYNNRTLTISRSLYWLSSTPAFKSPKTKAGERTVPIWVFLIRMFTKNKSGKAYSPNDTSKL